MADDNNKSSSSNGDAVEPTRPDSDGAAPPDADEAGPSAPKQKKPGLVDGILAKLGLNTTLLSFMFKGALSPIIGISMYQSAAVASQFTTLGYLIPIISILGVPIMPRGKFLQNMILNIIAVCCGAGLAMLILWSAVQARINTTPPGQSFTDPATGSARYNSSQSAVCAVWLFAAIWLINVFRAKFPNFKTPAVMFSIFINVSTTFGVRMATVPAARAFVVRVFTAMLTGLAIATTVSLFVFPMSSRMVVGNEFKGTVGLLRKIVGLQNKYLASLEELDMFTVATNMAEAQAREDREAKEKKKKKKKKEKKKKGKDEKAQEGQQEDEEEAPLSEGAAAAKGAAAAAAQVRELTGKTQVDIVFAKREVAWGKLDAKDLGEINKLIRNAAIPITGLTSIMDIFKRVAERRGWSSAADASPEVLAQKDTEKTVWNEVMKRMHEPFQILSEATDAGLEHAALQLEILPRPKAAKKKKPEDADVEAGDRTLGPGDAGFTEVIDEKLQRFRALRGVALRAWVRERVIIREEDGSDISPDELLERDQAQLYVLLYMERLMQASAKGMRDLVAFSDQKVQDGTMAKSRLIFPSQRRFRKWMVSIFSAEGAVAEESTDTMETGANVVFVGDSYNRKKDLEHLPANNAWQRFGNGLRKVSAFFSSESASFGFRVACATMTVGIIAFLESSQLFFIEQRLVWAMIIIAIGMTLTSGQSIFGFFCRAVGTILAMVFSYIVWYIVDGKTAGVIVFLWVSLFCDFYIFVKYPRFVTAVMVMMVTQAMIIGYELQVRKIGVVAASSSGQPYYPTYQLAPYRVAAVVSGCAIAFFWTIFPSPLTDRTWLRRDLSATLYLMANYYSVINSTVRAQIEGTGGDPDVVGTPAHQLQKIRRKIFGKVMLLLPSMKEHADWQKWEPTIGGKFPRATYEDIIKRSQRIMSYLTFMSYTTIHQPLGGFVKSAYNSRNNSVAPPQDLTHHHHHHQHPGSSSGYTSTETEGLAPPSQHPATHADRVWLDALGTVLQEISPSHHNIVSILTLLSNSLFSGQSLPPYLPMPRPYEMTRALLRIDRLNDRRNRHHNNNDNTMQPNEEEDEDPSPLMIVNSRTGKAVGERRRGDPGSRPDPGGRHLLDAANMEQPGYAEFAVLEICSTLVRDDLEGLVKDVSTLVGVVDFSYSVDGQGGGEHGKGKVD